MGSEAVRTVQGLGRLAGQEESEEITLGSDDVVFAIVFAIVIAIVYPEALEEGERGDYNPTTSDAHDGVNRRSICLDGDREAEDLALALGPYLGRGIGRGLRMKERCLAHVVVGVGGGRNERG